MGDKLKIKITFKKEVSGLSDDGVEKLAEDIKKAINEWMEWSGGTWEGAPEDYYKIKLTDTIEY